jgi:tetratricopeptide (TPR) repeat protein
MIQTVDMNFQRQELLEDQEDSQSMGMPAWLQEWRDSEAAEKAWWGVNIQDEALHSQSDSKKNSAAPTADYRKRADFGLACLREARIDLAIATFSRLVQESPRSAWMRGLLGEAYLMDREYGRALACFQAAGELQPRSVLPLRKLAQTLFALGRLEDAALRLRDAICIDQGRPELWSSVGWVLLQMERYSDAVEALTRALELHPGDIQSLKSLALARFALGQKEDSLRAYQYVLRLRPDDAESEFGIGILYVSCGNLKAAARQHERLLRLAPSLADELYHKIIEKHHLLGG